MRMSWFAESTSFSSRSSVESLKTNHQLLYAIGGVPDSCVAGVADSLNCVGTGAVGRWYLGPTAQPESAIIIAKLTATATIRTLAIRGRVLDEAIGINLVASMFIPYFPPLGALCVLCTATVIPSTR